MADELNPMEASAFEHSKALERILVLEEQLRQMVIERAELFTMAERTGVAESQLHDLQQATRIDPRIALFARVMDEMTKAPHEPAEQHIHNLIEGQNDAEGLSQSAARVAVWAMKIADRKIVQAREKLRQKVRQMKAEAEAQAPPT